MDDAIRGTLGDLASFLKKSRAPFAVIGGIAVIVRGEPRFTADIDGVVGIDLDAAIDLVRSLKASPFVPLFSDVEEVVRTSLIIPLRHRKTGLKVDLAVGLTGFGKQLIARAPAESFGDLSVPVATAEDLILMKILAGRGTWRMPGASSSAPEGASTGTTSSIPAGSSRRPSIRSW
jgi:hypothetical protein